MSNDLVTKSYMRNKVQMLNTRVKGIDRNQVQMLNTRVKGINRNQALFTSLILIIKFLLSIPESILKTTRERCLKKIVNLIIIG